MTTPIRARGRVRARAWTGTTKCRRSRRMRLCRTRTRRSALELSPGASRSPIFRSAKRCWPRAAKPSACGSWPSFFPAFCRTPEAHPARQEIAPRNGHGRAPRNSVTRMSLLIDADDTLWENNIYFERAFDEFCGFSGPFRADPASGARSVERDRTGQCQDPRLRLDEFRPQSAAGLPAPGGAGDPRRRSGARDVAGRADSGAAAWS